MLVKYINASPSIRVPCLLAPFSYPGSICGCVYTPSELLVPACLPACLPAPHPRVIQDCGFGHPVRQPHPPTSLQAVLISLLQDTTTAAAAGGGGGSGSSPLPSPTRPQLQPPPQQQQQQQAATLTTPGAAAARGADSAAAAAAAVARGFVNRLFTTLNWTLTEFTVAVGELHNLRGQRSILEVQNQYRRTGLMFELSVNFLRLLEFVVVSWLG